MLALAQRLRREGVDARLDQFNVFPPEGWSQWMLDQIKDATFVLVIGTAKYVERFEKKAPPGTGLGATWEGATITRALYQAGTWNEKFVPVLFAGGSVQDIPDVLRDATRFSDVGNDAGYEALYRFLTGQPLIVAEPLGSVRGLASSTGGNPTSAPPKLPALPALPVHHHAAVTQSLPRLQCFFGREDELKQISEALHPDARTWGALIDGPGGMGKTSLAIRAAELAPPGQFQRVLFLSAKEREMTADGQRSLSGFVLPSYLQMLNEMAAQIGRPELAKLPEQERTKEIHTALQSEKALVILDNLESLTSEHRDQVFTFLSRLPQGCKAIVTSRRRNDVDARIIRLDKLSKAAALEFLATLAVDRALLARASMSERETLYEETGGNPLLMRWIAGQLGKGRCRTVASAFVFIRSAPSDNDPLEFVFGDLLETFTENETKVLAALSHYTIAVEVKFIAELAGITNAAAQTALVDLSSRALVVPDDEEQNFALVRMVADFLRNKRPEAVRETGDRLANRAYALIVENGYRRNAPFLKLEAEWNSVAPALPLFVAGDNAGLQTVCDALANVLNFTGRWDEWLSLSQQAEAKAIAVADYHAAGRRAYHAGMIYSLRQQANEVLACAVRVEKHWTKAEAGAREQAAAIGLRGRSHELNQNYAAAIDAYRKSLELRRSVSPESIDVAIGLNDLAAAEHRSGDRAAAEKDYREALRIAQAISSEEGVASFTGNLAALALDQEDWPKAEALAREALPLSEKLGRKELVAMDCYRIAKALVRQGQAKKGLPFAQRSVVMFNHLGSPRIKEAQETLKECKAGS